MKGRFLFVTAAAVIMAVASGPVDAKELKFGTAVPTTTPLGKSIEDGLIPGIAKASGGELTMVAHYHGSVCGEQKCGEQANQGLLAAWTSSTANFGNFGTALSIFDLPYLFKDQDTANQIADGWLGDAASENAAKTTQHKVFEVFSAGGFRQLGNTERTIKSPADMKGIKFRVTKSPIEYTLIKTWGGIPIPFDWLQLYQGLQTGVVNGEYVQVPWQYVFKHHELNKYYTETGGAWGGNHLSMDLKQFNELSDQEKEWLLAGRGRFLRDRSCRRQGVGGGADRSAEEGDRRLVYAQRGEMDMWRAGAVGAWADAKGTYDPKLAERALAEQGLDASSTLSEGRRALGEAVNRIHFKGGQRPPFCATRRRFSHPAPTISSRPRRRMALNSSGASTLGKWC